MSDVQRAMHLPATRSQNAFSGQVASDRHMRTQRWAVTSQRASGPQFAFEVRQAWKQWPVVVSQVRPPKQSAFDLQ